MTSVALAALGLLALLALASGVPLIKSDRIAFGALLILLPVHILADVTTNYFGGSVNPGSLRSVVVLIVLILIGGRAKWRGASILIFVFLSHTFIGSAITSDPAYSTGNWVKELAGWAMFPLGYAMAHTWDKIRAITIVIGVIAILSLINLGLSQIFMLGDQLYRGDGLYLGGGSVYSLYVLVLFVLVSPVLVAFLRPGLGRLIVYAAAILMVVVNLVTVRRGSILALGAGGVMFPLLSKRPGKYLMYLLLLISAVASAYPLYGDFLAQRYEARRLEGRSFEDELRYVETLLVLEDIESGSAFRIAFGHETYNGSRYFARELGGRHLHIDLNSVLHGSGIFGLIVFISIHVSIGYRIFRYRPRRRVEEVLRASSLAVLVALLVIGLSGSLYVQSFRAATFLFLGGAYRLSSGAGIATGGRVRRRASSGASRGGRPPYRV